MAVSLSSLNIKWYDAFFLTMLAVSAIVVSVNWEKYHLCAYPLRVWILVDYASIFAFRMLMFVDNGLASGLSEFDSSSQGSLRFIGRLVVLGFLAFFLYPFLWAWTIIGTLWFTSARSCVPDKQRWGFLVWVLFNFAGLIYIACLFTGKWLLRRQAHLSQAAQGSPISELQVLFDLIRAPDRVFETADLGQETRIMGIETTAYHPGLFLTPSQREVIEGLIQQLPRFNLKTVPTECSECPICLEEFHAGNEVRGLPCAHNFHVACIDEWLRLNIKCPRCRCSVFPNLDLSAIGNGNTQRPNGVASIYFGGDVRTINNLSNARYIRAPGGESNLLRLQEVLRTIRMENAMYNGTNTPENEAQNVPEGNNRQIVSSTQNLGPGSQRNIGYTISETIVAIDRSPPARF